MTSQAVLFVDVHVHHRPRYDTASTRPTMSVQLAAMIHRACDATSREKKLQSQIRFFTNAQLCAGFF